MLPAFSERIAEYEGCEHYFLSRRRWFFGLLATVYAADLADTVLKGEAYFTALGLEYPIRNAAFILLCLAAMFIANRRFHMAFVGLGLIYQTSWIVRAYTDIV